MSIRLKLVLSNIAMVIIPLVTSFILAVILIGRFADNDAFRNHRMKDNFEESAKEVFTEITSLIYETNKNPEKLMDKEYLKSVNGILKDYNSGIAVFIDGSVYYASDFIDENDIEVYKTLEYEEDLHDSIDDHFELHRRGIECFSYDFEFKDKRKGEILFAVNFTPLRDYMSDAMSDFAVGVLIIILVTNGLLTFLVSRSILRPLKKLKIGAEQIKNGNLSFQINETSRDEVGQVCQSFEEMRQRLKQAIEKQIEYDENRYEFLANITHDLKTPITSIKGYIEGIMDGVADTPDKMDLYLKTIYKKSVDMDKLITDLTFYSNQTLNKVPFNFQKINIIMFIEDFIDEYQLELEKRGIMIEKMYSSDRNVKVKGDVEKLKRVVSNIIDNSLKYINKDEGLIKIDIEEKDNMIVVGIHDNGTGVKEEHLSNLFDRFYRADPSRNTSNGGSGLGLAIAKQIISGHGGNIWAESIYGKGTSIFFELEKTGDGNEKENSDN